MLCKNSNFKFILLALFLFSSCSQLKYVPRYSKITKELDNEIVTDHFIFHYSDNDTVYAEKQEIYIKWLIQQLEINPDKRIHYYKYKGNDQIYRLLGERGNASVRFGRMHTIWPWDNHEVVHVLVGEYVGDPPKLFTEGIAVACQTDPQRGQFIPTWSGTSIDDISRRLIQNSKLPPLDSLLIMEVYFKYSTDVTYPLSGSFVKYLIERHGINTFYEFIKICDWRTLLENIKQRFEEVYKKSLSASWDDWQNHVSGDATINKQ